MPTFKVNGDSLPEILEKGVAQVGKDLPPIDALFEKAYALSDAREKMNEVRVSVREALRHMDRAGVLTADQAKELLDLFPPRSRGEDEDTAENGSGNTENVAATA